MITTAKRYFCTIKDEYRAMMVFIEDRKKVASPVVILTQKNTKLENNQESFRGTTCSSFTSISLSPPIISISLKIFSKSNQIFKQQESCSTISNNGVNYRNIKKNFFINLLTENQTSISKNFSQPLLQNFKPNDLFIATDDKLNKNNEDYKYTLVEGLPYFNKCFGGFYCEVEKELEIGDHQVVFGKVLKVFKGNEKEKESGPLLYYGGTYRSVGDQIFMKEFEEKTLDQSQWTHEAHVKMAFNYFKEYNMDFDKIVEVVRIGINEYNKVNNNPLGYNETITVFYLKLIEKNLKSLLAVTDTRFISLHDIEFEDFLKTFPEILDKNLIFQFYSSKNLIEKLKYVPPDLKEI